MENKLDKKRRSFLKLILIGGGAFVAGKALGPTFSNFINGPLDSFSKNIFKNFRVAENKENVIVYDKEGSAIFKIEHDK